jgi:hypothetical protein
MASACGPINGEVVLWATTPRMVRRCFERLDEAGIRGEIRILRALSDTKPAAMQ